jgi:hypothetical protein
MAAALTSPDLATHWLAAWPQALASWSAYTQLRPPVFYADDAAAAASGMAGQIAAIRLHDQMVMVNLQQVQVLQIEDHALAILAHEIGHHVYVPGNLSDNARMFAAMKPVLFGLPTQAVHLAANLYGDLMINDRLQRRAGVDVAAVYRRLRELTQGETSETWRVYTRAYEHLWLLPAGTLAPPPISDDMNADALLISRLIRHYAGRWLGGARRFACILYPYLQVDEEKKTCQTFVRLGLCDCQNPGGNTIPDGLVEIDPAELGEDESFDRELEGVGDEDEDEDGPRKDRKGRRKRRSPRTADNTAPGKEGKGRPGSQLREPFEYGELLKALGLNLSEHEITTRYYRERALPHLIPHPARRLGRAKEPLAEGYETWETDEDVDKLDLFGSLLRSPELVPGVTTLQRVYGEVPGSEPAPVPLDLDIYVDCSGSMPNPAATVSYLALAGTILALSALRAGAKVQATLWSGAGQFDTTAGFLRDEKRILGVITGYIAGGTAFPLHVLRDTYANRKPSDPPAHIVVISDDGADTILANDEKGTPGSDLCAMALHAARGGGTMVLNLASPDSWPAREPLQQLGFRIHAVTDWEQLVAFARAFVRENYARRGK